MTAVHQSWEVLPHGPVKAIDDGILTVTGRIPLPLVALERRMTVVRLNNGSTIIYSAVALDEEAMKRIEALGRPRYLVVPGDAHRLDAKIYKERYPRLRVLTPPGARDRVEKIVPVDACEADFGDPDVTWHVVAGAGGHEEPGEGLGRRRRQDRQGQRDLRVEDAGLRVHRLRQGLQIGACKSQVREAASGLLHPVSRAP